MDKKIKVRITWQIDSPETSLLIKELLRISWGEIENGLYNHDLHGFMDNREGNTFMSGCWSIDDSANHDGSFVLEGEINFQFDSPGGKPIPIQHQKRLVEEAHGTIFERLRWGVHEGKLATWIKHGRQTILYQGTWKFNQI